MASIKITQSLKKILTTCRIKPLLPFYCSFTSCCSCIKRSTRKLSEQLSRFCSNLSACMFVDRSPRRSAARSLGGRSYGARKGFFPVVCVGSAECKRYLIALHQLRNPLLLQMLRESAAEYGYGFPQGGALAVACEPHTFEAIFCLLQRSYNGLTHIPPRTRHSITMITHS